MIKIKRNSSSRFVVIVLSEHSYVVNLVVLGETYLRLVSSSKNKQYNYVKKYIKCLELCDKLSMINKFM